MYNIFIPPISATYVNQSLCQLREINTSGPSRRWQDKKGGNHLDQKSNLQKTMEDIDGELHPVVDGQSLGENAKKKKKKKKSEIHVN